MMNRERIECSKDFFDALTVLISTSEKVEPIFGFPVLVNRHMPSGMAIMLDSEGNIVKIFKCSPASITEPTQEPGA